MAFTAVAECQCGSGKIVGYASVYGVTGYKHVGALTCQKPTPKLPVKTFEGVLSVEKAEEAYAQAS